MSEEIHSSEDTWLRYVFVRKNVFYFGLFLNLQTFRLHAHALRSIHCARHSKLNTKRTEIVMPLVYDSPMLTDKMQPV